MSTGVPAFFGLKAESNFPPVIDSVTLTELSPGNGVLFGNQSFSVDVVMTNEGKPLAGKALKGYIDGTFNEPVLTDYIDYFNLSDIAVGQTFYAVDASGIEFDGSVGSPTTSNFVSVALFQEIYDRYVGGLARLTQAHFLAVTDNNQLAYSPNGVVWEMRSNAGIAGAVFRKVQPLIDVDYGAGATGTPVFVACGQIDGGNYFLATCDNNNTFTVDLTLAQEVIFLTGNWAGTATELYYRANLQTDWQLIDSGNGPYQYRDGVPGSDLYWEVRNGNFTGTVRGTTYTALTGVGLAGGFDDFYRVADGVNYGAFKLTGSGGTIFASTNGLDLEFGRYTYSSTAVTGSSQYYANVSPEAPWWADATTGAVISGGTITFDATKRGTSTFTGSIDSNATLTNARDVAFSVRSQLGVFVGDGGRIIYAIHRYVISNFASDLNFSSIDEYDTLTLIRGNVEYPNSTWFVLNKYTDSMKLVLTGDFVGSLGRPIDIRFRGGSTTVGSARRYLQMINYAGAYNNVQSLLDSDPGFTDQQTTGTDIPDIRFPATYAGQDGFINRFEDVVQPGATFTVELQASNSSGSDTDSDTVTPS